MTARKVEINFENLAVSNSEECKHWIGLLDTAVRYHRDMVEMFEGEEDEVKQIHEAWANGIADAATFVELIIEEEEKLKAKKEFVVGVD